MAADPAVGTAALRNAGGTVVRASGAEVRQPGDGERSSGTPLGLLGVEKGEAFAHAPAPVESADTARERTSDGVHRELAQLAQQRLAVLVAAPDYPRTPPVG